MARAVRDLPGFDRHEFQAFGVPAEESSDRFRECVEIVLAAWRGERLSFEGRFWRFEGIEVLPKPLQQPHPPVWLAATSPDSIRRAAEHGYDILQDPHATHADIGRKRALYYETLRAHGFSTDARVIPTARLLALGTTEQEAEDVARAGASWTVTSYSNPSKRSGPPPPHWDPTLRIAGDACVGTAKSSLPSATSAARRSASSTRSRSSGRRSASTTSCWRR